MHTNKEKWQTQRFVNAFFPHFLYIFCVNFDFSKDLLNKSHSVLQLAKALRDLPNRVLNVSADERPELFQNIINVLTNPGWFY